jgi:hypothetical protein
MSNFTKEDVIQSIRTMTKLNIINQPKMSIRHSYQYYYSNFNSPLSPGFGDFLRGTYALWEICDLLGIKLELYFHNHAIKHYLKQTNPDLGIPQRRFRMFDAVKQPTEIINVIKQYYFSHQVINVGSNMIPISYNYSDWNRNTSMEKHGSAEIRAMARTSYSVNVPMPTEFKNFIKGYLQMSPTFEAYYNKITNNVTNYSVIHIRGGDPVGTNNISPTFVSKVSAIIVNSIIPQNNNNNNSSTIFVISDNMAIRNTIATIHKFKVLPTNQVCHMGLIRTGDANQAVQDTMVDFFLMSRAKTVYSLSVYSWTSGFSEWVTKIFDVPLQKFLI